MRGQSSLIFLCACFMLCCYVVTFFLIPKMPFKPDIQAVTIGRAFPDEEQIQEGISWADDQSPEGPDYVFGVIVPHHLLPSRLIANIFHMMKNQKPKTVFILGPNHYEVGMSKIITGNMLWHTQYGDIQTEDDIITSLINAQKLSSYQKGSLGDSHNKRMISLDRSVLRNEHAIYNMIPFIAHYFPDTQVVPIVLSHRLSLSELETFVDFIVGKVTQESVVVASVDFSHYLKSPQAEKNDAITQKAMMNNDWPRLMKLDNGYLDSPASIVAIQMLMGKLGKGTMEFIDHTNSGQITGNTSGLTTSYFTVIFY